MKLSLLFLVLWLPLVASTEKKIIIASFPTQQQADRALSLFKSKLSTTLIAKQRQSFFNIVARPSGKSYIIAIEPLQNYQEAQAVKLLLPREYSDAFINNYTPPKSPKFIEKPLPQTAKKPSYVSVNELPSQQIEDAAPVTEAAPIKKSNITEPKQKETDIKPITTVTKQQHSSVTMQSDPSTDMVSIDTKEQSLTLPQTFLQLEYLLIGISVIALIFLLCFLRYYRKYHHLKKQLISNGDLNTPDNNTTSKSSDIFFVRRH